MAGERKLTLCVFVDALGWELAQRHAFLDDVLPVKAPLDTVFGYSSTCDPTILTGLMPRDHGHFAFYRYDPAASPFGWPYRVLGLLPRAVMSRGRVRSRLSRLMKRWHGYTGYFQLYNMPFDRLHLFDYTEKRDIYEPGGINSGAPTLFDALRARRVPVFVSDWRAGEESNLAALKQAVAGGGVRFAWLFLGALDAVLHAHGTASPRVGEKLRWYESRLRPILAEARRSYDDVRLFVFSDHGMTDVTAVEPLMARIDALGLTFGRDYAAAYDSTMARFWFLNDEARAAITGCLAGVSGGRILSHADLTAWGCGFPGRIYGELFFLMHPGVLLCPSFMGERPLAGMHGYAPDHGGSVATFKANGPVHPLPRRLDDLHDLVLGDAERP